MNQMTLFRYNFRVMMLNNTWLVVFPLVVSQLTVYWFLLTREYSPDLPTQSVELVTPLLAAFLGAHILSAEYRSRVGALLASRPVNISRIVVLRLVVMLSLVWALALVSLLAYTYGKQPFDLKRPILACIPSTLFMAMLALTFATLFRHSLAGFAVAAVYWALDLLPGPPLQPYMSLRTLTAYYSVLGNPDRHTFVHDWWISKIVLLAAGLLLYLYHSRIVFTLGSSQTRRGRRRAAVLAVSLIALYLVSGAVLRVGYGYANRGKLAPNDLAWLRYQFAPFGPVPVASLFGSDFAHYLGEIGNPWKMPEGEDADVMGDSVKHRQDLQNIVERSPNSAWAPSAAEALARLASRRASGYTEAVAYYRRIADRYPNSPYVAFALREAARLAVAANHPADAQYFYTDLLKRSPNSVYNSEALRYVVDAERQAGHQEIAAKWADTWTKVAPVEDRFEAWINLGEIRKALGDTAGAADAGRHVLEAVREFRHAMFRDALNLGPYQKNVREKAANAAEAAARKLI